MRVACFLAIVFLFGSCAPSPVLYTDAVFREAAPEVLRAWPIHSPLPPGSNLRGLQWELSKENPPSALIGAVLSAAERIELATAYPEIHLVFFVPAVQAGQLPAISVDRAELWAVVGQAAAKGNPGVTAAVLFPADATTDETRRFSEAWMAAGGGVVTSQIWPQITLPIPESGAVFQWVGSEADSLVGGLNPSAGLHGNPGLPRMAGVSGLTWKIRESGLLAFLQDAVSNKKKNIHFLPLETVSIGR